jgi:hypothetical protein
VHRLPRHLLIGRANHSGLGTMTREWHREMRPYRTVVLDTGGRPDFTGLGDAAVVSINDWRRDAEFARRAMLNCELVVSFETFYRDDIPEIAERFGIKSIVFPMWECSPDNIASATLVLCCTDRDQQRFPVGVRCEWPIAVPPESFAIERQWPPRRFVCNVGHGGLNNRNNAEAAVLASRALVGTGARMTVRTHDPAVLSGVAIPDPTYCTIEGPVLNHVDLYDDADVVLHLVGIEGLSLPTREAASRGIPVIGLALPQYRDWSYRVPVARYDQYRCAGNGTYAIARPDVDALGRLLYAMATDRLTRELPPPSPTWSEFAEWFTTNPEVQDAIR